MNANIMVERWLLFWINPKERKLGKQKMCMRGY